MTKLDQTRKYITTNEHEPIKSQGDVLFMTHKLLQSPVNNRLCGPALFCLVLILFRSNTLMFGVDNKIITFLPVVHTNDA